MANTLTAPENEMFPNRKRWTRKECELLAQEGRLTGRYELIDGEILSKMGQKPLHRITLKLIAHWLSLLFGDLYVQTEDPILVPGEDGETNEPEPDIAVTLAPTTAYSDRHPRPDDLLLVVEVSDTTLRFDLSTKALLYARSGVREYWVMDVTDRRLYIHRTPTPTGYAQVTAHSEEEAVALADHPETTVLISTLLPPTATVA
ncbi:MAG TPA: Uma2 family endonuclease [Chthonomonadaceae bacterium]|nr:Uma2 family endonuclease [Chthonomonadaceae bacterium]